MYFCIIIPIKLARVLIRDTGKLFGIRHKIQSFDADEAPQWA